MLPRVAAGDPEYFEAQASTEELVRRLRRFLAGGETHESLEAWGKAAWGRTHPAQANRAAFSVMMNAWNAATRVWPGDASCPFALRPVDVAAYLRLLQRGEPKAPLREVGGLKAPLSAFAEQLGLETERHVVDGLGWFEYLQFASAGSGRVFVLSRPLTCGPRGPETTEVAADAAADAKDVLCDLFETLAIDHEDVHWLAEGFEARSLTTWVLWRQDDNGNRAEVARFTGFRKAEAAFRRYAALMHKQLYWVEALARR